VKVKPLAATLFVRAFGLRYIPLIAFCRPTVVDLSDKRAEIKIPLMRRTKNHLGSMYFGVLAVGADCAGGFLAMQIIRANKLPMAIVFKDFKAEFLKRPDGDVHFICEDGEAVTALIDRAMKSGVRENLPVTVIAAVPSQSHEPVARFVLTLSVKKKAKS
jgi:acyl-coenzyme A thioesterase PaaI-like protein